MKHSIIAYSLFVILTLTATAPAQSPPEVYRKSLGEVVAQIEAKWGIEITYHDFLLKDLAVEFADWKLEYEMETAMRYAFTPLGLEAVRAAEGKYTLRWQPDRFNYYELPEAEGKRRLDRLAEVYGTREAWDARRVAIREHILQTLGLADLARGEPPKAVFSGARTYDGYAVENVALETAPGVFLCGSLYVPLNAEGKKPEKMPAMLCPHGHFDGPGGNPLAEGWGRYRESQQIRCAMLAKMGVLVFSYDMFAWGESSLQVPYAQHRDALAIQLQTWGALRAVDYLLARGDVDPARLGVTGASGGGTQAFLLSALEPRITLSVPVVMVSCHYCGGCACESGLPIHFVPGASTNNAEIAAVCAPRPQMVVSDGKDWTRNTPGVEFPFIRAKYALYDAAENAEYAHFPEEGHDYGPSKRQVMYAFAAKHFALDDALLKDGNGAYDESGVTVEPAAKMWVFGENHALPEDAARGLDAVRAAFSSLKKRGAERVTARDAKTPYRALADYTAEEIHGWQCYVVRDLREDEALYAKTMKLLEIRLYEIAETLPAEVIEKLRTVKIWVDKKDPVNERACYHVSPGWLRANGVLVQKAKGVAVTNAADFLHNARWQPMMVLHELTHAYHDQFLPDGYENAEIREAFEAAREAGIYESQLHRGGRHVKCYAITNPQEYFAELTECYFGENDYYPFVRAELKIHDPRGYELIRKMWGQ